MADRGGERRGRGRASAGAARQAPAALSAAFTDSGGNAGLMADLRTFRDFRVHGCAAVAGVTAQNPRGVYAVHDVPENVFRAQAEAVLSCFAVKAAKTGMLHSAALRKRVPIWTAHAPSIKAAAIPLPSAIPPAAITGRLVASQTCGTSTIVVSSPTWPPLSPPSGSSALPWPPKPPPE